MIHNDPQRPLEGARHVYALVVKDFLIPSAGISAQESKMHNDCKIALLVGVFKLPEAVSSCMPTVLSQWSYFSVQDITSVWSPVMDQVLECKRDTRAEAQEHDSNAIGVYLISSQKETLSGHVPIELSRLLKNFIEANAENKLCARVTGKRKREVGLAVLVKFSALTAELRVAKILERELNTRAKKYSHFELKNVVLQEHISIAG